MDILWIRCILFTNLNQSLTVDKIHVTLSAGDWEGRKYGT
jgi:hypothetical protein